MNDAQKKLVDDNMDYEGRKVQDDIIAIELSDIEKMINENKPKNQKKYLKVSLDLTYEKTNTNHREDMIKMMQENPNYECILPPEYRIDGMFYAYLRINGRNIIYFRDGEKYFSPVGCGNSVVEVVDKIYDIVKENFEQKNKFIINEI